jgi:hypothetical protein
MSACFHAIGKCCADKTEVKNVLEKGNKDLKTTMYCYMCEVSLVVALALLQQCNCTTLAFP